MAEQRTVVAVFMGSEWQRVAIALREVDEALPGQLRKDLRNAVRPYVARAKAKVRTLPTHGSRHTGLRRRVARGVGMRVGVGRDPKIDITTSMANPDEAIIPRGMDRREGWRHPVFGNRDAWVTQHTGGSWFRETFASSRNEIEHSLTEVLEQAAETIDRAGAHGPSL